MRQEDCSTLWDPQQKMLDGRMWSVCNVGPQVCSVEQTEGGHGSHRVDVCESRPRANLACPSVTSPKTAPSHGGTWPPPTTRFPGPTKSPHSTRNVDRFSRVGTAPEEQRNACGLTDAYENMFIRRWQTTNREREICRDSVKVKLAHTRLPSVGFRS